MRQGYPAKDVVALFTGLCEIAEIPSVAGRVPGPVLVDCDRIDQEQLFTVQEKLTRLLLDVAVRLGTPYQALLVRKFPGTFTTRRP